MYFVASVLSCLRLIYVGVAEQYRELTLNQRFYHYATGWAAAGTV